MEEIKGRNYPYKILKCIAFLFGHWEASTSLAPSSASPLFDALSEVSLQTVLLHWRTCWGSAIGQGSLDPWWKKIRLLFKASGKHLIDSFAMPNAFCSVGSLVEAGESGVSGCLPDNSKGLWNSKWATVRSMGLVSVSTWDILALLQCTIKLNMGNDINPVITLSIANWCILR